jgi:IS5 family transposase
VVVDFTLAPAFYHDVVIAPELLEEWSNIIVVADKGYVSYELEEEPKEKKLFPFSGKTQKPESI